MATGDKRVSEVEGRLRRAAAEAPKKDLAFLKNYHGTGRPVLGLTVPLQRRLLRHGYSFSDLSPSDQLPVWDRVWRNAKYFETRQQPLFFLAGIDDPEVLLDVWETVEGWADDIDGWAPSDLLSDYYSRVLELAPETAMPVLRRWNTSPDLWKRRQSVVSLIYYASKRRSYPPVETILALVEALLDDPEHYVQRGVGWCLRETRNAYQREARAFLSAHATDLSAVAFAAATEKLSAPEKDRLKTKRRSARKRRRRAG